MLKKAAKAINSPTLPGQIIPIPFGFALIIYAYIATKTMAIPSPAMNPEPRRIPFSFHLVLSSSFLPDHFSVNCLTIPPTKIGVIVERGK